jgi:hypothetical protein
MRSGPPWIGRLVTLPLTSAADLLDQVLFKVLEPGIQEKGGSIDVKKRFRAEQKSYEIAS